MPKQRVLFIVPALQRAGAESQLVTLVNRLPDDQFERHLLSYRPGDDLSDDVDASGVTLHHLQRRGRLDLKVGRDIGRIIDENEIDLVHCTLANALLYGYMGIRYADRDPSLITAIHTTKNASLKLDIADSLVYRHMYKRCDQIWFVSSTQEEVWWSKMPFLSGKSVTIHNGIDLQHFDAGNWRTAGLDLKASLGISAEEKVICSVAGFRAEKMHSTLIRAFSQVRKAGVSCKLLLAGTGPVEESLREQVGQLNLESHVEFLGALADVRPLLAASDCKCLVSAAETFSMAMLEAMAMQVPVITTSVGGASEAIEDGETGYLVPPGDAAKIADRIEALLGDEEKRVNMGRKARQIVIESFDVETMVSKSAEQLAAVAGA